ncbi:MAG: hypothetical protein SWX82_15815 [Cyanobacteriota bacterium]|nr:hypothetical protein [Cyanobacteriota bacterium]
MIIGAFAERGVSRIAFVMSQAIACFIYANIDLIFGVRIYHPNS